MGFDKMLSFFNKNLSNIYDELYDKPIVVANHIMIDVNFILYNSIKAIEEEVNNIILLICGIPYTDINIIEGKIKDILDRPHWESCELILDGNSIEIIINNFKTSVNNNIENILQIHLLSSLLNHINTTHVKEFIKSINIFFDGIPAYSKILEQRRRRMKTFLDSKNRKTLLNNNYKFNNIINDNDIIYDYNDWVKSLYSIDMILGPDSSILLNIAKYLEIKMASYGPNIYISNSMIPGEADFKIFRYIIDNKLDCDIVIHSCDSDFIFMVLWYQVINIVGKCNININYINYIGDVKQLYSSKKLINSLMDKYKYINNITDDISINVIFDTLAIILMFGNDIMPISYELGSELSLKQLYETHYKLYSNNKFIININDLNVISLENLAEWLKYIRDTNSFNIIILSRFYKIPFNTINTYIDENKLSTIIDDTVLLNNKGFFLEKNPHQSYYNHICSIASNMTDDIFNRPFKMFFTNFNDAENKYNEITKNKNVEEYLSFYISLCLIFFNNFDLYSPFNLLYYGDILAPSISMIIDYINNMNINVSCVIPFSEYNEAFGLHGPELWATNFAPHTNDIIQKCYNILKTPVTEYFNPLSHHIFITPYILEYYIEGIENVHLEIMLNMIEKEINGIWYKENSFFNLKNINPEKFISISNRLICFYKKYYIEKFNCNHSYNNNITLK
jgi:hypothetical protein